MKTKKQKPTVAEEIMKVLNEKPQIAEEIKKELKDTYGSNIQLSDIRVNLLRLLRKTKIKRKKEKDIYKYFI
jgi:predicted transcriptional regulator